MKRRGATRQRRWPIAPVIELAAMRAARRADHWSAGSAEVTYGKLVTNEAVRRQLGVSQTTFYRWLREGIPDGSTDRIAAGALGVNPRSVWPEWS